ncbi:MAG: aminoglycoside phosphotransferase family protein [Capsulimonas sp.]|uniref:aminoglycoside phosphotransferase family protein n=1 Tax=Capsulimonas sp. TaxID=2494211 RepID=UPI0032656957
MDEEEHEETLAGGNSNVSVTRIGDTVRRAMTAHSPSVHRLLRHLESKGWSGCPRLIGVDERGREILTYLPGECGFMPYLWHGDDALTAAAHLLRGYHEAVADFVACPSDSWAYAYPDLSRHEIICHNDFAPYNWICQDEKPSAVIDFDDAGPGPRLRDVAYAAYWMAPLSFGGGSMKALSDADIANNSRRLKLFCACYGVAATPELLDMAHEVLIWLCNWMLAGVKAGDPVRQKMEREGYWAYWDREARTLLEHRSALERNL